MNTYIERKLKRIKMIGLMRGYVLSCDIYYNDLADPSEQFVVKLRSGGKRINEHFRSNHIRKSLRMAEQWLRKNG